MENKTNATIKTIALTVIAVFALVGATNMPHANTTQDTQAIYSSYKQCDYEDGSNDDGTIGSCIWDGNRQGNHQGDTIVYDAAGNVLKVVHNN